MTKALVIRDLKKVYSGGVEALKGINLVVEQGDFYGLLGPNGAGKSTTLSIITSLVNKTSGKIEVFGHDTDTHFMQAKRCLGVVPQEFNFNHFEKVYDIVVTQGGYYGIPLAKAKERAEHYIKKIGLWDKRDTQARMLSGGMKRRLMIARALVHEPKLLILDEPTAGVDIELRRSMWDFLREINAAGVTIILTTHYLEEAESLCRKIAIIDKGDIILESDTRSLVGQLRRETFIFDVINELHEVPAIENYETELIDTHCFEVTVQDQGMNGIFDALTAQGIQVRSMKNKTNRLEELFVSLVAQGNAA